MIIAQLGPLLLLQASDNTTWQASAAPTHPASFSFVTDRELIINLDGMWRFHPGDDAQWSSPAFDDSAWPLLRSDESWTKQGYSSLSGFAWYRFNVEAPPSSKPLALLLPSILTDYEVFQNGRKIGGFGRMPPHGSLRFSQTLLYHLDPMPAGATVQFAIRVWHHPIFASYLGGGPRYAGARLGEVAEMEDQFRLLQGARLNQVASFFALGILNAVISVTVFGLYFYRRTERVYLWFALLLLSSASVAALTISSFILHFPLGVSDFLAECFGAVGVAASLLFFSTVLESRRSWIWRLVLLIAVLDPLNVILYVLRYLTPAASTSLRVIFDLPIVIYIVVLLSGRALAGNRNARLLFALMRTKPFCERGASIKDLVSGTVVFC